jgi:peptidoglycan/LPS O-acetylase OafA/YrhL
MISANLPSQPPPRFSFSGDAPEISHRDLAEEIPATLPVHLSECASQRNLFHESPNLDLLRSIAVGFVIIGHFLQCFRTSQLAPPTFWDVLARIGVLIFFVHTSLVLMLSMDRMKERGFEFIRAFYLRRFFRIYPLSAICIGLVVLFHVPSMPLEQYAWKGWNTLASNLLLAQNLTRAPSVAGPLWSLPWEVQMYFALPFVYLGFRKQPMIKLLVIWALACAVSWITYPVARVLTYSPCFLGGILAYTLLRQRRISTAIPAYLWPTAILVTSAMFAHFNASPWTRKIIYPDWILCAFLGLIIPFFRNFSAESVVGQIASKVAKYSYGIYLSHMPLMWLTLVRFRGLPIGLRLIWFFAMILIVPVVAYHLVEHPLIKIGKRFTAPQSEGTETRSERSARREFMQQPVPHAI